MRTLSLFTGIGGFDLGFEREGFSVEAQVEIDPIYQAVLSRHWPDTPRHGDVTTFLQGFWYPNGMPRYEVVIGGFPCQPFSTAGQRKAKADDRYLWPPYYDIVRAVKPRYVVIENSTGLRTSGVLADVLRDLANSGYDAVWSDLRASEMGYPHRRPRVLVVAYPHGILGESWSFEQDGLARDITVSADEVAEAAQQAVASFDFDGREADGFAGRMAFRHGITARMVGAGGISVVPNVARFVARVVKRIERERLRLAAADEDV